MLEALKQQVYEANGLCVGTFSLLYKISSKDIIVFEEFKTGQLDV